MIYVFSKGGFGNQAFQISLAHFIKNSTNNKSIYVNRWFLFLLDFTYKRKFVVGRYVSSISFSFILDLIVLFVFLLMKLFKQKKFFNYIAIVDDDNYKNIKFDSYKLVLLNGHFIDADFLSLSFFSELYAGLLTYRDCYPCQFIKQISYIRFFEDVTDSFEQSTRNQKLNDLLTFSKNNNLMCFSSSHILLNKSGLLALEESDFSDLFVYGVNASSIYISDSSLYLVVGIMAKTINNVSVHYFGNINSFCDFFYVKS